MKTETEVRERIEELRRDIDGTPAETLVNGFRDAEKQRHIKELVWVLDGGEAPL